MNNIRDKFGKFVPLCDDIINCHIYKYHKTISDKKITTGISHYIWDKIQLVSTPIINIKYSCSNQIKNKVIKK